MLNLELRNDRVIITGYVNAVERESRVISSPQGRFIEKVAQGTFDKALKSVDNVELRLNHNEVLGSTKSGNLELREDNIGLYAYAEIDNPSVIEKAKNNQLVGWSFSFKAIKDDWQTESREIPLRTLTEIALSEVSLIDNTKTPAYSSTSVEMRENQEVLTENRFIDGVNTKIEPQKEENNLLKYKVLIERNRKYYD